MDPALLLPRLVPIFRALLLLLVFGSLAVLPAFAQVSRNITLLSNLNQYPPGARQEYFACWSYVHQDGREYAVIMTWKGASIVRLTDPTNPVEVGFITAKSGLAPGFPVRRTYVEAKQYGHYLYLVTDFVRDFTVDPNDEGMAIIDMRDPDHPHKVASLMSPVVNAHTVAIDQERGLLFANGVVTCNEDFSVCELSMKIFSLADPERPSLLATYPHYVHDIHIRGNRGYASLIFEFEGGQFARDGVLVVLDLSDPANPVEITRILTPRIDQHSTWTSEDGCYLYVANEVNRDGLTVWDVSDLSDVRQLFTFEDLPQHIVHQPHVVGNTLSLSYYTAGVRLMDIRNPAWPVEFGYYDTWLPTEGEGFFFGAWECAPFYPSGIFVVSDTQTGLWVFRADPVNYGIVRGTVRESGNGPTIAEATVTVQPAGLTVKTGQDGRYAFAVPPTGAATVTVSTFAFEVTSKTASVALDSDNTVDFALRRLPAGSLRGTVRDASGVALGAAELEILGTPHRAVADAGGEYLFPSVPEGSYSVRAARQAQAARTAGVTIMRSKATKQDFTLGAVLFFDDTETDKGWVLRDPDDFIVSGAWTRAAPVGKIQCDTGDQLQPDRDHSFDPGTSCFVTDNRLLECVSFVGAVTGVATLTSPTLNLAGVSDPRIGYWRWYVNAIPRVPSPVPFIVRLSNDGGATWVTVKTIVTATPAWVFDEIRVADFFPNPSNVLVRFVVDNSTFVFGHVEAAVDDIAFYAGGGSGSLAPALASAVTAFSIGAPRPSPTRGATEVELSLGHATRVRAAVYDLQGRLARQILDASMPAGRSTIRWDGRTQAGEPAASGVYWMRIQADQVKRNSKIVISR